MQALKFLGAVLIGVVALIYGVSPVDLVSELALGPVGYVDDIAAIVLAIGVIRKLLTKKADPGHPAVH